MPRMYSPRPGTALVRRAAETRPEQRAGALLIVNNEWHCMDVLTRQYSGLLDADARITSVESITVSAVRALDDAELSWVRSREFQFAMVGMGH